LLAFILQAWFDFLRDSPLKQEALDNLSRNKQYWQDMQDHEEEEERANNERRLQQETQQHNEKVHAQAHAQAPAQAHAPSHAQAREHPPQAHLVTDVEELGFEVGSTVTPVAPEQTAATPAPTPTPTATPTPTGVVSLDAKKSPPPSHLVFTVRKPTGPSVIPPSYGHPEKIAPRARKKSGMVITLGDS
jgi:hypothetical protein